MKIENIKLNNFRIYKGLNEINFNESQNKRKNINLIAGFNGFGKTTFLTSLVWCFYGRLMVHVEDKYRDEIRGAGGYNTYLNSLFNKDARKEKTDHILSVEITLNNILIPSIPCETVTIKRSFDFKNSKEELNILIDGMENELTKSVGYDIFINDFILPREIAKFFFFDAEKIVSLAEAKTKDELRSLSKAYSEVLGIQKYEDLKSNLESLLVKLNRKGVTKLQEEELQALLEKETEYEKGIQHNEDKQSDLDKEIGFWKNKSDKLQEKLIREGNSITLEQLKELKTLRDELREESVSIKSELRTHFSILPLVIAGKHLKRLKNQMLLEKDALKNKLDEQLLIKELEAISTDLLKGIDSLNLNENIKSDLIKNIDNTLEKRKVTKTEHSDVKILLDLPEEKIRQFIALVNNIKTSFLSQLNVIIQNERNNSVALRRVINEINQAEARKDNHLAKQFRKEKIETDFKVKELNNKKEELIENLGTLKQKLASHKKVRVEFEKEFHLLETDKKKHKVTKELLAKVTKLIVRIKEEKKHSLQKSILLGLNQMMHKKDFINDIRVNIVGDVMDIDLLDKDNNVIDKDSLSNGEKQLYASALLKALVDESGIQFPVFIDSPLQKFDKQHSINIINEFYPNISDQVVLFPLLEKELTEAEYNMLKPYLQKTFLIQNQEGASKLKEVPTNNLFKEFNKDKDVYAYKN